MRRSSRNKKDDIEEEEEVNTTEVAIVTAVKGKVEKSANGKKSATAGKAKKDTVVAVVPKILNNTFDALTDRLIEGILYSGYLDRK